MKYLKCLQFVFYFDFKNVMFNSIVYITIVCTHIYIYIYPIFIREVVHTRNESFYRMIRVFQIVHSLSVGAHSGTIDGVLGFSPRSLFPRIFLRIYLPIYLLCLPIYSPDPSANPSISSIYTYIYPSIGLSICCA